MFERFGEFDSAEEINECAAGLVDEKDFDSLYEMAAENGLSRDDVDDYLEDIMGSLCNDRMAALGKLEVEEKALKATHVMVDWVSYIKTQCIKDEQMARAVRMKGKSLVGCMGAILKEAYNTRMKVPAEIVKAAGIGAGRVELGMPGMARVNEIIKSYYLGK